MGLRKKITKLLEVGRTIRISRSGCEIRIELSSPSGKEWRSYDGYGYTYEEAIAAALRQEEAWKEDKEMCDRFEKALDTFIPE